MLFEQLRKTKECSGLKSQAEISPGRNITCETSLGRPVESSFHAFT